MIKRLVNWCVPDGCYGGALLGVPSDDLLQVIKAAILLWGVAYRTVPGVGEFEIDYNHPGGGFRIGLPWGD